jgi:hypothetical protein
MVCNPPYRTSIGKAGRFDMVSGICNGSIHGRQQIPINIRGDAFSYYCFLIMFRLLLVSGLLVYKTLGGLLAEILSFNEPSVRSILREHLILLVGHLTSLLCLGGSQLAIVGPWLDCSISYHYLLIFFLNFFIKRKQEMEQVIP